MYVESFTTMDEMLSAMEKATEEANANLHENQKTLTWGSHWVRFVDVRRKWVCFGRVHTPSEMHRIWAAEDLTAKEAVGAREEQQANLDRGYMFGLASDRFNVTGELGDTHRYDAWPIEERLYRAAQRVEWNIDRLDAEGQALLEIAYGQWRAWVLETRARAEGRL